MVRRQGADVGKVPQLKAYVLYSGSSWHFVLTKHQCDSPTAVVQMPRVWLALGGWLFG